MLFLSLFRNATRTVARFLPVSKRVRARGALLCLATAAALCNMSCHAASEAGGESDNPDDSPASMETLVFEPSTTLMLAPSETATVSVVVEPPRRQTVTFEILTEDPGFDGFLLKGQVQVGEDGRATVDLKAPTQPSTFILRASLGTTLQATRAVSVSDQGYGTLIAQPNYSGKRNISQWTASARAGITCEQLDSLWTDGPLVATGSQSATITSVPSGPSIALTIRGGELVSGCTTVKTLGADKTTTITVALADRPIDTGEGRLEVTLGVDSTSAGYVTHLEEAISKGIAAFKGEASSEAELLLSRMSELLTPEEADEFATTRQSVDMVSAIHTVWTTQTPLSTSVYDLLTDAADLIPGADTFVGELELNGSSSNFFLTTAASVPAEESGFFESSGWMATGEAGDTLVLGGALSYDPLVWLAAISESSTEGGSAEVVVESGACSDVAVAIATSSDGAPFGTCEEECLTTLCEEALADVFGEVTEEGVTVASLQVGITGDVTLMGPALVKSLAGTWVGRLESEETALKGAASALLMSE